MLRLQCKVGWLHQQRPGDDDSDANKTPTELDPDAEDGMQHLGMIRTGAFTMS